MTTLRQAAQQARQALEAITRSVQSDHQAEIAEDAITALREALAQEHAMHDLARLGQEIEQAEPVAWMFQHDETGRMNYVSNDGRNTPDLFLKTNLRYALVCPLYTAPPQRPWVGLTDGERNACLVSADPCEALADPEAKQLMEDIEEKLRSKNT